MNKLYIIILFFTSINMLKAQSVANLIYDANHLNIVNANAATRLSAEYYHNTLTERIYRNVEDVNTNLSALVLVQNTIHQSLTQVDQALKSSRSILYISTLISQISRNSQEILLTAKSEPWLLLFAEQTANSLKDRSMKLALEVSDFVLKESSSLLLDYEKRDYLLQKITLELQVIRALLYSIQRSMTWAKVNGIFSSLNPYASFINMDKQKANEILQYYRMLNK